MTHLALFERLHCLRGMENAFEDFYLYPEQVDRLLGALTDYQVEIVRAWGRLGNVDGWFVTDDWGTQTSLMISPELWRKFFAARYRRLCDEAHRCGIDVIFHSCGNVTAIVGDLIDAGVDVIDPLQPEAMDLQEIAREYGGKVAFCGGISDQELAVFTVSQVRDHVRRTIDTLGRAVRQRVHRGPFQRPAAGHPAGKSPGAVRGRPCAVIQRRNSIGHEHTGSRPTHVRIRRPARLPDRRRRHLLAASRAYYDAGIGCVEYTMTMPDALGLIERAAASLPGDLLIGAGTVMDGRTVELAVRAGASSSPAPVSARRWSKPAGNTAW